MQNRNVPVDIQIKADDEVAKGRFANLAQIGSSNDSFVLDFAFVNGRSGWLLSRILMSPEHAKRFHQALGTTLLQHDERVAKGEAPPDVPLQ